MPTVLISQGLPVLLKGKKSGLDCPRRSLPLASGGGVVR